jgi:hypothetical protein
MDDNIELGPQEDSGSAMANNEFESSDSVRTARRWPMPKPSRSTVRCIWNAAAGCRRSRSPTKRTEN